MTSVARAAARRFRWARLAVGHIARHCEHSGGHDEANYMKNLFHQWSHPGAFQLGHGSFGEHSASRRGIPPFRWQSVRHAKVQGSEVRVGSIIERKGRMFQVLKAQHTQQGRGGATVQVELRDVQSGLKSTEKLRTSEAIDLVFVDDKPFVFLYTDGDSAVLMEPSTFDQVSIPMAFFGDAAPLLREGLEVTVQHFNGAPLSASLPPRITDTVAEAEPHFKGQTATPSYKKVKLSSGLSLQVPAFVVEGDEVVIQTSDLTYVTRAKSEK